MPILPAELPELPELLAPAVSPTPLPEPSPRPVATLDTVVLDEHPIARPRSSTELSRIQGKRDIVGLQARRGNAAWCRQRLPVSGSTRIAGSPCCPKPRAVEYHRVQIEPRRWRSAVASELSAKRATSPTKGCSSTVDRARVEGTSTASCKSASVEACSSMMARKSPPTR